MVSWCDDELIDGHRDSLRQAGTPEDPRRVVPPAPGLPDDGPPEAVRHERNGRGRRWLLRALQNADDSAPRRERFAVFDDGGRDGLRACPDEELSPLGALPQPRGLP